MYVPRMTNYRKPISLLSISFLFAIAAITFTLIQADSVPDDPITTTTESASSNLIESETEEVIFRCFDICGDDNGKGELELEDPDKVVDYQWNWRVPVCSGSSCETASCSELEDKLSLLEMSEFECERHRKELQTTAGCACSVADSAESSSEDNNKGDNNKSDNNNGNATISRGGASYFCEGPNWWIVIIVTVVAYGWE